MRVMHEVTGCSDCSLADWHYGYCQHPVAQENKMQLPVYSEPTPPRKCPLRKGELLITLTVP